MCFAHRCMCMGLLVPGALLLMVAHALVARFCQASVVRCLGFFWQLAAGEGKKMRFSRVRVKERHGYTLVEKVFRACHRDASSSSCFGAGMRCLVGRSGTHPHQALGLEQASAPRAAPAGLGGRKTPKCSDFMGAGGVLGAEGHMEHPHRAAAPTSLIPPLCSGVKITG